VPELQNAGESQSRRIAVQLEVKRLMRIVRHITWALLLLGACALGWWFQYGWWQSSGDTMIERDYVRFGPVRAYLSLAWALLLMIAPLLSTSSSRRKKEKD
jgi:hypothetical protein